MADGGEQSQSRGSSRTHLVIRRRAAAVLADGSREIRWLEDWRLEPAYVLLGDPGAGKSWSLKREANEAGGEVVAAEVFQAGLVPPTAGDTVFIDALDEARGGSGPDALTGIAQQLLAHGKPNFRITCREADWRQESDRRLLERVSPSGSVTTLHLVPLEREEILELLSSYGTKAVLDPDKFMAAADKHGVTDLLGNPLLLDLVVDAVATNGGRWPETRASVYESACRSMARERSLVHLERSPLSAGQVDAVLHDSGLLCALIILTASRAEP